MDFLGLFIIIKGKKIKMVLFWIFSTTEMEYHLQFGTDGLYMEKKISPSWIL